MGRMKTLPKLLIIVLLVGGVYLGIQKAIEKGWVPQRTQVVPTVPRRVDLPDVADPAEASRPYTTPAIPSVPQKVTLPVAGEAASAQEIRMEIWAWNAQAGLLYANGGARTRNGSIMDQYGVNLHLKRQDDVPQMQNDLIAFASELAGGNPHPRSGVHYIAIMGDGAAAFFAGLNPQLEKVCHDCTAEAFGSAGMSRGEDKFMGLLAWKENPQNARGALVAGYLRDGDWNIALKWAGDNGIPNNPDEHTYDPSAINWVAADSYIDAAQKYVTGYCETRPVVANGNPTGKTQKVCVDGVVTWTPGDVIVARERGGLVSIVSTREYRWQMPNTIIGIKKWNSENAALVENFLAAVFEGGRVVKESDASLMRASQISAEVYNEETAEYWYKYFKGVTETDKQGLMVELGGSSVNTLADNLHLFGLNPGSINLFSMVYRAFGDIVVQQYPNLVPSYPPVDTVLNTRYVQAVAKKYGTAEDMPDLPQFVAGSRVQSVVSRKSWNITFEFAKATFSPSAEQILNELLTQTSIAGELVIEVHGHTDSVGNPQSNMKLSEARAFAVKNWLETKSSINFPKRRVHVFAHGQLNPISSNDTEAGRTQNRRVEIVMGTTG